MKSLELFAGTCSFSNVARGGGWHTFTTDFDAQFNTDYTVDIMKFDTSVLPWKPDFIWASPPCETFSVASMGYHWTGGKNAYEPKTDACRAGIERAKKAIEIIEELQPSAWIIENPRGVLRKMPFMAEFNRYTVTYCQYGDSRMKPTDLWSNLPLLEFLPMCKNGSPCHEAAPRGAKTGTQGIKGYRDRSRVPDALCLSVVKQIERVTNADR